VRTEGSGRKPGTPNKNTKALIDKAEDLGVDPFHFLCLVMKGDWRELGLKVTKKTEVVEGSTLTREVEIEPEVPFSDRFSAAKELASYMYPKRKAVALSADEEKGFNIIITDYRGKKTP